MKKILITGASGVIGKSIVTNILARNRSYFIQAIGNHDNAFFSTLDNNRFVFTKGDCREFSLMDSLVKDSHAVIHLAAPASFLMYKENPIDSTMNTIQSFLTLLEVMKKHYVKKIVHASTSAVYEGHNVPYKETMIINPPELKSFSKKVNEELGKLYSSNGITCIAMRPMSVYGDDESKKGGYANVISLFVWAMVGGKTPVIWGDGKQTRDFIHADDAAEVFCLALEKKIPSQPLNVGTGRETSFNQLIEIINSLRNTHIKPKYVPVPIDIYAKRLLSDNTMVKKVLGFEPKISIQDGIKRVITFTKSKIKDEGELAKKQMYFETLKQIK